MLEYEPSGLHNWMPLTVTGPQSPLKVRLSPLPRLPVLSLTLSSSSPTVTSKGLECDFLATRSALLTACWDSRTRSTQWGFPSESNGAPCAHLDQQYLKSHGGLPADLVLDHWNFIYFCLPRLCLPEDSAGGS